MGVLVEYADRRTRQEARLRNPDCPDSRGILRSAIATRLDSFDVDEAYHITAGVSYVRLGDYRLNPEHPPLVKLWVGAFLPSSFRTPQLRPMAEKWDERHFTEVVVFEQNDPDLTQRRARIAMFLLNGILLLAFALSVWRAFGRETGPVMAIGALAFLEIDPSIAAHLPVVLTDLPVALLASTPVLLAWSAFRSAQTGDSLNQGGMFGAEGESQEASPPATCAAQSCNVHA